MEAACVVSLGGAAKTHLLDFFFKMVEGLAAACEQLSFACHDGKKKPDNGVLPR